MEGRKRGLSYFFVYLDTEIAEKTGLIMKEIY